MRLVRSRWGQSGRTAIVTGGASGIGLALGTRLVQLGAHVTLADIDGEAANRRADELNGSAGGTVIGRRIDVSDEAAFRSLVDEVIERYGRLFGEVTPGPDQQRYDSRPRRPSRRAPAQPQQPLDPKRIRSGTPSAPGRPFDSSSRHRGLDRLSPIS